MRENKKVMKKVLSVILAILTVSALMIVSVAAAGAKVPENSEYVSLDKVEVEKKGNNLAGLFTPFAKTDSAPEGANGENVYKAEMTFIGGTNGGACIAVDLKDLNLKDKKVVVRYYIDNYTPDGELAAKLAENANANRGTDHLPVNYPQSKLTLGEWALLDITNGVNYFLGDGVADNGEEYPEAATSNFALTIWAGLKDGDGKKVNVYIDGIYLVSEGGNNPTTSDASVVVSAVAVTAALAGICTVVIRKKHD